jgi:lysophospholipase L1-like esterase
VPELEVTVRQYGWGGETAPGFLARMTNDCLRFNPTVATTCYGMNDHGYGAYRQDIGDRYRKAQTTIVQAFKANGARVVLGSPGCVSKKADVLNLNLCELRNIDIDIADQEQTAFADVFWPMLVAGWVGTNQMLTNYAIAGGDGVHPGWAGQTVMAYAFLRAFGLDGGIGTYTVDLKSGGATASQGHEIVSAKGGEVQIKSARYPFCATGATNSDNSIRSAMLLVPFNQELNRLMLVAKNPSAKNYKVTWGKESKSYSAAQLEQGVNLAADFALNPFSAAFEKVDAAVAAKQAYETHQIKSIFHGPEFKLEPDAMVKLTERARTPLAAAIKSAFVPVTHTIKIDAE